MADELEYVITGALLECSEGTVPMPFQATPRNVRLQGLKVGNASDKTPYLNIPSFVICKKLTQMAGGTPVPCVPAPIMWQDTYPVQVNKQEVLIFRSCIRCSSGQGKITFLTSGQTPVPPEVTQQLEEMQKESEELLKEAEAEKNSVGEAGFAEGLIPIWGSGRDMIHSAQTGHWGMAALNGGFLVLDVVGVVGGFFTFGAATAAEMGLKTGIKAAVEAGTKVVAKGAAKKLATMLAKSAAMKKGLLKGLTKLASTRVCMLACFPAGTSVAVEEGYRNIEELAVGDRVWSRDEFTGQLALQPVTHTSEQETDHLIHLRLGGERIQTTAEHPFFTHEGWQKAGTLAIGQEVMRSDGQWVAITQADHRTEFDQPQLVYNIEVAHAHTYFIGKWMWWVHNANVCVSKIVKQTARAIKRRPKVPAQAVRDAAGNLTDYGKWYYERPFKFRSGVRDKVWDSAKNADEHVLDPVSGKKMNPSDPWDMGHKPGYEFRKHQQSAADRKIGRKKFMDEHNNPDHYRPETPSSNRSHAGEDPSDEYLGY